MSRRLEPRDSTFGPPPLHGSERFCRVLVLGRVRGTHALVPVARHRFPRPGSATVLPRHGGAPGVSHDWSNLDLMRYTRVLPKRKRGDERGHSHGHGHGSTHRYMVVLVHPAEAGRGSYSHATGTYQLSLLCELSLSPALMRGEGGKSCAGSADATRETCSAGSSRSPNRTSPIRTQRTSGLLQAGR